MKQVCWMGIFFLMVSVGYAAGSKIKVSPLKTGTINVTVVGVHVEGPGASAAAESITVSYTDPDGNSKTAFGTLDNNGQLDLKGLQIKPGSDINATDTTEGTTDKAQASANIFFPPSNYVVSAFAVAPGSQMTFAGNTFAISGGFTTVDTNVDYNPMSPTYGLESGHIGAVNLVASGPGGNVQFNFGHPATQLNLASVWAQAFPVGVPSGGLSTADNLSFPGSFLFNNMTIPFDGTFNGTITFSADGSTEASGTLNMVTSMGDAVGTLSAIATPVLVTPEPACLSLLIGGGGFVACALRRRRI